MVNVLYPNDTIGTGTAITIRIAIFVRYSGTATAATAEIIRVRASILICSPIFICRFGFCCYKSKSRMSYCRIFRILRASTITALTTIMVGLNNRTCLIVPVTTLASYITRH